MDPAPIFVHGILPRSGTNFLFDLLALHPDCAPPPEPVREDLLLEQSDGLVAFADSVRRAWDPRWGDGAVVMPRFHAALGEGLVSFLWSDRTRRLVTKSPSVRHLDRFFDFFPSARVLILIRDGRSVAQSCMDTFNWSLERAARAWAAGADDIHQFMTANAERPGQWRLVRYESLVKELDTELPAILQWAGLDVARYDFTAAHNLPVRGSSAYFGQGRSHVHWDPVQKDASFSPTERWHGWSASTMERFDWLAGEQMRRFGYGSTQAAVAGDASLWHRVLDASWSAGLAAGRVRSVLGAASRPLRRRLKGAS